MAGDNQTNQNLEVDNYYYDGIGRVKFLVYQFLSSLVQVILIALAVISGMSAENPSPLGIAYILAVVGAGLVYGIYLLYQRSLNIGINPWIGLVLAFLPIIQIFWGLGLFILPQGFWEHKRLDTAAKVWGGLIAFFFLIVIVALVLLIPVLNAEINKQKQAILESQTQSSSQPKHITDKKNPLEQSYGLDTKCPDYLTTQQTFDKILNAVRARNPENSKLVLGEIAKGQGSLNPLVIGMAANLMVQRGQSEKALFWFYAGELRTLSDLNLYKEKTIPGTFLREFLGGDFNGGRVTALTPETKSQIGLYVENNRDSARMQLARALAWDKKTPKNYNRLWLGKKGAIPQSQWQQTDLKTRNKFQQTEVAAIGVGPVESVFKPR